MTFVLCDPGLLLPPSTGDEFSPTFWLRLIEWATDRRVKLGQESFQLVVDSFTERGWPEFTPTDCPPELRVSARGALNRVLASVRPPVEQVTDIPRLTPRYLVNADAECALAIDLGSSWSEELLGLASFEGHWERRSSNVELDPPPPESVLVLVVPNQPLAREADLRVGEHLAEKRLTIVGALRDERFVRLLCQTFKLTTQQVRWIEAEPDQEPELDALKGLSGHRDLVCCILGAPGQLGLGHAGSEKAMRLATDRGVETVSVDRPNRLLGALRQRFGTA